MAIRPPLDEFQLLNRIAGGDEYAFSELFRWYAGPLGEFVLKLTVSVELAEEIVQDCFVKIWLKRDTLPAIKNFSGYLFIICRNEAFQVLKKIAAEKVFQNDFEKYVLDESNAGQTEEAVETYRTMIEEAVAKLPPQQKKAYMLSRYERLKPEEIAVQLGISSTTVKKHLRLAVVFIKKDVGNHINPAVVAVLTSIFTFR